MKVPNDLHVFHMYSETTKNINSWEYKWLRESQFQQKTLKYFDHLRQCLLKKKAWLYICLITCDTEDINLDNRSSDYSI